MGTPSQPIAVVGMACRFAGAEDLRAFERLLSDGVDAIHAVHPDRWNLEALQGFHDGQPLPHNTVHGGWLDRVRDFDPALFRMSPREAKSMDPKQRLALLICHRALEHAGIAPLSDGVRNTGVFIGTAQSEYLQRFYNRGEIGGAKGERYAGTGNDLSFTAGRISAAFGFEGPSHNVNTACSTSLVAIHMAVQSLQTGESDMALAGGVSIIESPEFSLTMDAFGMLSPDARCKAFDDRANGYVRAEGCGVVVLKRLQDALDAGDTIHGVIRGSATNHNGQTDALLVPDREAQVRLMRHALQAGQVEPATVQVVEAHGTGTPVGDPIESHAIADVFAAGRSEPVVVGSVKTNIGHSEVSAGVAGFLKALLQVRDGHIFPHLHLRSRNPRVPGPEVLDIPGELRPWKQARGRRSLVNSFGISGINAAVVVEQPPEPAPQPQTTPRQAFVLPLSAWSDAALQQQAQAYLQQIDEGASLQEVAATAALRRAHHPLRAVIVTADEVEGIDALRALAGGGSHEALRIGDRVAAGQTTGMLFTGQGSQWSGMGKALYDSEPVFRKALDRAALALQVHTGHDIRPILFDAGRKDDLDHTTHTQPALFALEVAMAELWRSWGVVPDVVVGHSIGELAAAVVAGAYPLEQGAEIVGHRARLMGALPPGGRMQAVFASAEQVTPLLAPFPLVGLAGDNGPRSVVISGDADQVAQVLAILDAQQVEHRPLTVSHAFHSPLMDPMLAAFHEAIDDVSAVTPRIPLLSNRSGAALTGADLTPAYWCEHIREAVLFRQAMNQGTLLVKGQWIEVGPRPTLSSMGRRALAGAMAPASASLHPDRPLLTIHDALAARYLAGLPVDWSGYWAPHPTRRIEVAPYPLQLRELWVDDPGPVGTPAPAAATTVAPQAHGPKAHVLRWTPVRSPAPSATGHAVVLLDAERRASGLVDALSASGWTVDVVAHDTPELATPETCRDWITALPAEVDTLVDARALGLRPPDAGESPLALSNRLSAVGSRQLTLLAALTRRPGLRLVSLTENAYRVRGREPINPSSRGLWGLARVFRLEHPDIAHLRLDLHAPDWTGVARIVATPTDDDQLALRSGRTFSLRLTEDATPRARLRAEGTWLITGGLGGLGAAVAERLLQRGASRILLLGRSAPKGARARTLKRLQSLGEVSYAACDVSDPEALAAVMRGETLRGVVHCAGTLADARIQNMTPDTFGRVFPAKVAGAWALHEATRDLDLDAFVLFSSVTSTLGAPGQANYAWANSFMDALAHQRHAEGLAAVSLNWGPWAEVGMAADMAGLMNARGIRPLQPTAALDGMEGALLGGQPQLTIIDMQWEHLRRTDAAIASVPFFADIYGQAPEAPAVPPAPVPVRAPATPVQVSSAPVGSADGPDWLTGLVAHLMRMEPGELHPSRPLSWQGFDSVMAVDLQQAITERIGVEVPLDKLAMGPSLDEIASLLPEGALSAAQAPAIAQAAVVHEPARTTGRPAPGGVQPLVVEEVARLMGFDAGDLDLHKPLSWQGFDSVMAVDLQAWIDQAFGVRLPMDLLAQGPRLTEILDRLQAALPEAGVQVPSPAVEVVSGGGDALRAQVAELMGFTPAELDPGKPLAWQGFDSVMAVDLQAWVRQTFGVELPMDLLAQGPRLTEIEARLPASQVREAPPAPTFAQPTPPPEPEEIPADRVSGDHQVNHPAPEAARHDEDDEARPLWVTVGAILVAAALTIGWIWIAYDGDRENVVTQEAAP